MRRNTVPAPCSSSTGNISYGRLATYAGATALATGTSILGNCTHEPSQLCAQAGANVMWAERGTSPRDTETETTRGLSVDQVREIYFDTDWKVHEGPRASTPHTRSSDAHPNEGEKPDGIETDPVCRTASKRAG